jgi:uncharacterized protein YlbG (UPF0298 family)
MLYINNKQVHTIYEEKIPVKFINALNRETRSFIKKQTEFVKELKAAGGFKFL